MSRPVITVLDARPMSEVAFRPDGSQPPASGAASPPPVSPPTSPTSTVADGCASPRSKKKGPAPPPPPARPKAPPSRHGPPPKPAAPTAPTQSPVGEYTGGPLRPGRRPVPAQRPSSMYSRLPPEETSPEKPASWSSMEELRGEQQDAPLSPGTRKKKVAPPPPPRTTPVRPTRPHSIAVTGEGAAAANGAALSMMTPQDAQPSGAVETVLSVSVDTPADPESDLQPPRPAPPRPRSLQISDTIQPPELPPRSPSPMSELAGEVAAQARKGPTVIRPMQADKITVSEESEEVEDPVYMNLIHHDAAASDLETAVSGDNTTECSTVASPKKRPTIIRAKQVTEESTHEEETPRVIDIAAVVADIPEQSKKLKPTIIRPTSTSKEYPALKRSLTPEPRSASPARPDVDVNANVAKPDVKPDTSAKSETHISPAAEMPVSTSPVKAEVKVAVKREITPEPRGPEDPHADAEGNRTAAPSSELSPALEIKTSHVATKAAVVVPVAGVTSDSTSTETPTDTLSKDLDKILTLGPVHHSVTTESGTEQGGDEADGLKDDIARILQQKPSEPPPLSVEELLAQNKNKPEFKPMVVPQLSKPVLVETHHVSDLTPLSPHSPGSPGSKPPTKPKPPVKPKPGLAPNPLLRRPGKEGQGGRPASMYEERMQQKTKQKRPISLADEKSSFVMSAALKTKLGQEVIAGSTEVKSSSAPTSPVISRKSHSPAGSEAFNSPPPGMSYKSPGSPGGFRKSWLSDGGNKEVKKLDSSRLSFSPQPFTPPPGSPAQHTKSWESHGEIPSSPKSPKPLLSPKPKFDKGPPPPLSPKPSPKSLATGSSPGRIPEPQSPLTKSPFNLNKSPPPPLSPKPVRKPPVSLEVSNSSPARPVECVAKADVSFPLQASPQTSPDKSGSTASPSGGLYSLIKRKMSGEIQPPEELLSPQKELHIVHPHFTAPASPQPVRAAAASTDSSPAPAPSSERRDSFDVLCLTTVADTSAKVEVTPKKHRPAPLGIPESIIESQVEIVKSPSRPTPPLTPTRTSSLPPEFQEQSDITEGSPSSPTPEAMQSSPPLGASPPLPARDPSAKSPSQPIHPISPLAQESEAASQPARPVPHKPARNRTSSSGSSSHDDVPVPSRPAPPKPTRTPKRSNPAATPPASPGVPEGQEEVFDEVASGLHVAPARPQPPKGAAKSKAVARAAAATTQLQQQQKKSPPKPPVRTVSLGDHEPKSPPPRPEPPRPPKAPGPVKASVRPPPPLPPRPGPGHPLFHYVVQGPHAIALYDYQGSAEDELTFKAGDVILLDEAISDDWLRGHITGAGAMFPANFVDVIEAPPKAATPVSPPRPHKPVSTPDTTDGATGPRCVARFDFEGESNDDLSFVAGDMIRLTAHVGDEWLRGAVGGRCGIFPLTFVEIIEDLPASSIESAPDGPTSTPRHVEKPYCIAKFDFDGETSEDLSFKAGDHIELTGQLGGDWLHGSLNGRQGIFPSGFVDVIQPLPGKEADPNMPTSTSPQTPKGMVLFDYTAQAEDDLSVKVGDEIDLISWVGTDWLRARLGTKQGILPANFVHIISPMPTSPMAEAATSL